MPASSSAAATPRPTPRLAPVTIATRDKGSEWSAPSNSSICPPRSFKGSDPLNPGKPGDGKREAEAKPSGRASRERGIPRALRFPLPASRFPDVQVMFGLLKRSMSGSGRQRVLPYVPPLSGIRRTHRRIQRQVEALHVVVAEALEEQRPPTLVAIRGAARLRIATSGGGPCSSRASATTTCSASTCR